MCQGFLKLVTTVSDLTNPRHVRLIDSCITQLKAQGPSKACNESKEEEEAWGTNTSRPRHRPRTLARVSDIYTYVCIYIYTYIYIYIYNRTGLGLEFLSPQRVARGQVTLIEWPARSQDLDP